jgi:hypothetical protein
LWRAFVTFFRVFPANADTQTRVIRVSSLRRPYRNPAPLPPKTEDPRNERKKKVTPQHRKEQQQLHEKKGVCLSFKHAQKTILYKIGDRSSLFV